MFAFFANANEQMRRLKPDLIRGHVWFQLVKERVCCVQLITAVVDVKCAKLHHKQSLLESYSDTNIPKTSTS